MLRGAVGLSALLRRSPASPPVTSARRALFASTAATTSDSTRPGTVHRVDSDDELRALLRERSDRLTVVDWSASWCGPCRAMAPVFERLSSAAENASVVFASCDIDELPEASAEAGISSVPTFHLIKHNQLVEQLTGADEQRLTELIKKHR